MEMGHRDLEMEGWKRIRRGKEIKRVKIYEVLNLLPKMNVSIVYCIHI